MEEMAFSQLTAEWDINLNIDAQCLLQTITAQKLQGRTWDFECIIQTYEVWNTKYIPACTNFSESFDR
jgi:hypothetical protein